MITTYTRRGPGQGYLKTVLSERINSIVELQDMDLEINPLKVYDSLCNQMEKRSGSLPDEYPRQITAEAAAENQEVQAIIAPRLEKLITIANSFLDIIIRGIDEVPYGIRWICKQIRSLSKRKYPDAQAHTICTLIGSFFFLRFINPAIVSPISYMLVDSKSLMNDGKPWPNPQKTLTYVRGEGRLHGTGCG